MSRTTRDNDRFELLVERSFVAQHFLTVPDPEPPEGEVHSHRFTVELLLAGDSLGEYNYLVNINDLVDLLDDIERRYRDAVLNDLPEFAGENPSVERFARVLSDRVREELSADRVDSLQVRIWEDDLARASHETEL